MFKRSRLIGIFTGLFVLFAIQVLAPETFAQCTCTTNTVTCTETLDATDATTLRRPALTDPESTCAVPQVCPSESTAGPYFYDVYTFTNNTGGATPDCFTITLNANTCNAQIGAAAYTAPFNPNNACANYLGDAGANFNTGSQVWGVNVPNGTTFSIVVMRSGNTTGCAVGGTYILTMTPCPLSTTAADGQVTGRITDDGGAPLAGTVITLSGTQNRKTITDANGFYSFASVESNGFYTVRPSSRAIHSVLSNNHSARLATLRPPCLPVHAFRIRIRSTRPSILCASIISTSSGASQTKPDSISGATRFSVAALMPPASRAGA